MPAPLATRPSSPLAALLLAAALGAAFAGPARAQHPWDPDACTSQLTPGTVTTSPTASADTEVFTTPGVIAGKKVVLLISDYCFDGGHYSALASHYALNGFIAAVFDRHNVESLPAVFDSLDFVIGHLGLSKSDPALEIALVGHGVGGKLAMEAAEANSGKSLGYPIKAVATLAPAASTTTNLDGWDAKALLVLYGSQDEDLPGYGSVVDESFVAYDLAGTEDSTTCTAPPCPIIAMPFEKTMVYIYGADHAGLVGLSDHWGVCGLNPQSLDYLTAADTLCISKAYTTGFLRQHLLNDLAYEKMLRGESKPLSISSIFTAEADGYLNPAGSPLRLSFQFSPMEKRLIKDFSAVPLTAYTNTPDVYIAHSLAGGLWDEPFSVRHWTDYAMIGWNAVAGWEWIRFGVPAGSRDASSFTHFALRLGQMNGATGTLSNSPNEDQSIWVGLEDVNDLISWHQVNFIPPPDLSTEPGPEKAISHLGTRRIKLEDTARIDLSDVRGVYLLFNPGTRGTLFYDSLEWHRD